MTTCIITTTYNSALFRDPNSFFTGVVSRASKLDGILPGYNLGSPSKINVQNYSKRHGSCLFFRYPYIIKSYKNF